MTLKNTENLPLVTLSWDGDHDDWTGTVAQMRKEWGGTNLFDSAENDGGIEWSCGRGVGDSLDEILEVIEPGERWTSFNCTVRISP